MKVVKRRLTKVVNDSTQVRCASGPGTIREEVWANEDGSIARYNLAFIHHLLTQEDNGRVLGYDNSHGFHHRHYRGSVTKVPFTNYETLLHRFLVEVEQLRKEKA